MSSQAATAKKPIKILKMRTYDDPNGKCLAFFDLEIGPVMIYGCKLAEGEKGRYVQLPSRQGKDKKWYNIVRITKDDWFSEICNAAKAEYQKLSGHSGGGASPDNDDENVF